MTTQYGQLEGNEKIQNKEIHDEVIHDETIHDEVINNEVMHDAIYNEAMHDEVMHNKKIDYYKQISKESLDFVNEMKSAILEDWRKVRHDYFIIESRKKDLEKALQDLLQQEDKAGSLFIPSAHNENKKEQHLIQEELHLVEEQQKRKQEILEQKEQEAEKMNQLHSLCVKSFDFLLYYMDKERNFKSNKSGEEVILENGFDIENRDISKEDITDNNLKESLSEENISLSEENIFVESVINEGRNFGKIAVGVGGNQKKSVEEEPVNKEESKAKGEVEGEDEGKGFPKTGVRIENNLENGSATALFAMQEYERKRIAREIHDSTIQDLTTLIHRIEFVEKLIDMDVVRAKMELATLKEIVKKSVDETRNIIYDLHPVQIEEFGLKATLQKFVARIKDEYKISVNLLAEDDQCEDCAVNLALYRIIQEACNNSIRYSEATQIVIELKYMESQIHLFIEDNGLGFDMEEVQKKAMSEGRGFGLSVMKERVYLLSGKFDISSASGAGTKITVIIPRLV